MRKLLSLLTSVIALTVCLPGLMANADPGASLPSDEATPGVGTPGGTVDPVVPANLSVPKVLLAGFSTTPSTVVAGADFDLNFTLENTSRRTRVQNMKVTLASGEGTPFLPASGSSSLFVDRISVGDQSTQTIRFHSLPSLEARPYEITVTMDYEDATANAYQAQEVIAIAVTQPVRVDTTTATVLPASLMVGQDASVTFNILNQGRAKLYNAQVAVVDGQGVTAQEAFVGTIEPGASGAVELFVHADKARTGSLKLAVTYEDVNGAPSTLAKEVALEIVGGAANEAPIDKPEEVVQTESPSPLLPVLVGLALLAIIAGVVALLVRRARRRRVQREDVETIDLLGEPLVPTEPR